MVVRSDKANVLFPVIIILHINSNIMCSFFLGDITNQEDQNI